MQILEILSYSNQVSRCVKTFSKDKMRITMNRSLSRDRRKRSATKDFTTSILVTDNIVVRFEGTKRIAKFKLVVLNDSNRSIEIERIECDLETVVAHNSDANGIQIRPDRDFSLNFSAVRHYAEMNTTARIRIFFKDAITITRLIQIIHNECAFIRKHAHDIQRQKYPIPSEFFDVMDSINSYQERMVALDALDALIPSTQQLHIDNYSDYFHGLLYLEQMSIERNFRIYHRDSIMFQQSRNWYAIQIEDLFETRPSLSVGKFDIIFPNKCQLNLTKAVSLQWFIYRRLGICAKKCCIAHHLRGQSG